jgi:hypothetical protein
MVIELSGVQFGLKSYAWFQNRTSAQREFDLKSQVWFQTKIARHEVQLPLYYIHFEIAQFNRLNTGFWSVPIFCWFVKKEEPETLLHLILRCHVTKTHSSVTEEKHVSFKQFSRIQDLSSQSENSLLQSSILVVWLNDVSPSFLLWLWLSLLVVFGEEIEGAAWISCELWNSLERTSQFIFYYSPI